MPASMLRDPTYASPPLASVTTHGSPESYSAFHRAPPLLTRFTPPSQCSTDWFVPVGTARPRSAFSDAAHNADWSTCQPYGVASGTYSAGVCPVMSEFQSVTKIRWDGIVSDEFFVGACCGIDYRLSVYRTVDGTETQHACFSTARDPSVRASVGLDNNVHTPTLLPGPVTVVAQPMYIAWRAADTSLHPPSDALSLEVAMKSAGVIDGFLDATATAGATAAGAPEPSGPPPPPLSTGAIVGIAVGFAVCAVAIAALGFLALSRRWKRRKKRKSGGDAAGGASADAPGEAPDRAPAESAPRGPVGGQAAPDAELEMQRIKGPHVFESQLDSPSSSHTGRFRDEFEIEPKTLVMK